jgi:hypothetical protein
MQPASQRRRGLEVHVIAKVPQMDGGSPPQSPIGLCGHHALNIPICSLRSRS